MKQATATRDEQPAQPSWRVLVGDVREQLAMMPAASVQCVVTSPPYWGLRDYGHAGQIGLEATPDAFVAALVAVFREVRRVLKDGGVCWLNLGDSYAGNRGNTDDKPGFDNKARNGGAGLAIGHRKMTVSRRRDDAPIPRSDYIVTGLKPKDLVGIPWRVAFALQADGWYLRADVIWSKPNPMPESVTDRPTKAHEYVFLLTKRERYYYDADAIAERVAPSQVGRERADLIGGTSHVERGQHSQGSVYKTGRKNEQSGDRRKVGFNDRWDAKEYEGKMSGQDPQDAGRRMLANAKAARDGGAPHDNPFGTTRNSRSVWTITTQPYPDAHFATFPEALPERCIKAGSRIGDTVLDPFCGSGTTGQVAIQLGRSFIGIELNPEYAELARNRIGGAAPLFSTEACDHPGSLWTDRTMRTRDKRARRFHARGRPLVIRLTGSTASTD